MQTSQQFQNALGSILESNFDKETKFSMINLQTEMEVLRSKMEQTISDAKKNSQIINKILTSNL